MRVSSPGSASWVGKPEDLTREQAIALIDARAAAAPAKGKKKKAAPKKAAAKAPAKKPAARKAPAKKAVK